MQVHRRLKKDLVNSLILTEVMSAAMPSILFRQTAGTRMIALVGLMILSAVNMASSAEATKKPNILVIISDDMGFSDLGCYGGTDALTPNLDRLAQNGVRFTQFYNTARCCPTRASLLTVRGRSKPATKGALKPAIF